jgi:DNA-binding NarL/FixJ family response regulator
VRRKGRDTASWSSKTTSPRGRGSRAVDSHPLLRLVASAGSCEAARAVLAGDPPDVLLTDLDLPDGSGLELIRLMRARGAGTQSMVITVFGDEQHVVAAIEAGALGYLLKDATAESIGRSILELIEGGLVGVPTTSKRARYQPSTPRRRRPNGQ